MKHLGRVLLMLGTGLFVLFVWNRHMNLALGLLGLGVMAGFWRIRQVIRESREREARMWSKDEPTVYMPPDRRRP